MKLTKRLLYPPRNVERQVVNRLDDTDQSNWLARCRNATATRRLQQRAAHDVVSTHNDVLLAYCRIRDAVRLRSRRRTNHGG